MIFAERKSDVDDIHEYLLLKGIEAVAIHGNMGIRFSGQLFAFLIMQGYISLLKHFFRASLPRVEKVGVFLYKNAIAGFHRRKKNLSQWLNLLLLRGRIGAIDHIN